MKPLIETLRPGQKAKLANGEIVWRTEKFIKSETTSKISNVDVLMSTDYEIIEDKACKPSNGDFGWVVGHSFGVHPIGCVNDDALPTKQAAEHASKLQRIITAIMRMPGYGGDRIYIGFARDANRFTTLSCNFASEIFDFGFDTYENAKAAAEVANKLVEELS